MPEQATPGRRERNKADKRRRIEAAARELFAEHGYSVVTTQAVAQRAEVGTGTLFRYAHSKGELLCMVANEDFRNRAVPDDPTDVVGSVCALAAPYVAALSRQPENALAYHRETLFGEPGPHRDEALRILGEVRGEISGILSTATGNDPGDPRVRVAAQSVFDVLYMELVRTGLRPAADAPPHSRSELEAHLRAHVAQVVDGVMPSLAGHDD